MIEMIDKLLDLVYSVYFNLRYLPLDTAVKLPIRINRHVKIKALKHGGIIINAKTLKFGLIRIGLDQGSFEKGQQKSMLSINDNCKLVFNGQCSIGGGYAISISNNGEINIGNNVHFNANAIISSNSLIKIEDNVGTGWDCTIIDWDGHDIIDLNTHVIINPPKPILIGKNCWIGAKVTIMKGTCLCMNTIVPYGSIITKTCDTPYSIFGGIPNHIIKNNIARTDKLQ